MRRQFRLPKTIADKLRSLVGKDAQAEIVFEVTPDAQRISDQLAHDVERSLTLTSMERQARLSKVPKQPTKVVAITAVFLRNADVIAEVLQRTDGGADTITNAQALCPTCHRRLHFGQQLS